MNTAQAKVLDEIYEVSSKWRNQNDRDKGFLLGVLELAKEKTTFYRMLLLWEQASSEERQEIIADLEDMFEDYRNRPASPVELPYIRIDKLSSIAKEVQAYKSFLKEKVEAHGGVTAVARKVGISQPSLSRFLNSGSLPRKTTLEKLAKVLKLTQREITFEWAK